MMTLCLLHFNDVPEVEVQQIEECRPSLIRLFLNRNLILVIECFTQVFPIHSKKTFAGCIQNLLLGLVLTVIIGKQIANAVAVFPNLSARPKLLERGEVVGQTSLVGLFLRSEETFGR